MSSVTEVKRAESYILVSSSNFYLNCIRNNNQVNTGSYITIFHKLKNTKKSNRNIKQSLYQTEK